MIRRATPSDIKSIVGLGIEALKIDAYEQLVISEEKVRAVATECVSAATNFAWVAERDGVIGGALVALVTPNIFHERSCANVIMWYTKIPGDGVALMRQFMRWANSRPAIKMIQYTGERGADRRVSDLAERCGLNDMLPVYLKLK